MRSLSKKSGTYLRLFCRSTMTSKLPSAATNRLRSWIDLSSTGPVRSVAFCWKGLPKCGNRPRPCAPRTRATTRPMVATSQNRPRISRPPNPYGRSGAGAGRSSTDSRSITRCATSGSSAVRNCSPDWRRGTGIPGILGMVVFGSWFVSSVRAMLRLLSGKSPSSRYGELPRPASRDLPECRQAGQTLADDKLVDLGRTLICHHGLQVGGVAHHRVLAANAVGTQDRAALPGDGQGLHPGEPVPLLLA